MAFRNFKIISKGFSGLYLTVEKRKMKDLKGENCSLTIVFSVAIVLIVRARSTERKAPIRLLQLASLIVYCSMVIVVVGIMFIPYAGNRGCHTELTD